MMKFIFVQTAIKHNESKWFESAKICEYLNDVDTISHRSVASVSRSIATTIYLEWILNSKRDFTFASSKATGLIHLRLSPITWWILFKVEHTISKRYALLRVPHDLSLLWTIRCSKRWTLNLSHLLFQYEMIIFFLATNRGESHMIKINTPH